MPFKSNAVLDTLVEFESDGVSEEVRLPGKSWWRRVMADHNPAPSNDESTRMIRAEIKPEYRADTNQNGRWFVWRRVSASGWATHCPCESGESARAMVERLNAQEGPAALGA